MSDYELHIKVKNGPMMRAMRSAGFNNARALYKASGVNEGIIGKYLNLKVTPISKKTKKWNSSIIQLAETLKTTPAALFPPQHYEQTLAKNTAVVELDLPQIEAEWAKNNLLPPREPIAELEADNIQAAIATKLARLRPSHAQIVRMRHGLNCDVHTLEEISQLIGKSKERIRQIVAESERIMKYADEHSGAPTEGHLREALDAFNA